MTEGRILPRGEGRARRYIAPVEQGYQYPADIAYSVEKSWRDRQTRVRESRDAGETAPDWLSVEAIEIRTEINRPLMERRPVAYNAEFLSSYIPNETCYLPAPLREDLAKLGKVGVSQLPAGTYLRKVMDRLLIDLSWNSSRLEGNTYSLLETQRLLDIGEAVEGKSLVEAQMILNHKDAIEMLAENADELAFDTYTICNLHAVLSDGLVSSPMQSGRVRTDPVGISGTVFNPLNQPQFLQDRFEEVLEKAEAIADPFEQSFFTLVHLPYLQAFEDVNKRLSRLACNIPLVKWNLCPLSFVKVPKAEYVSALVGVYELNRVDFLRDVFVWAYRRSCDLYGQVRSLLGEPDPFRVRYRSDLKRYVREVVRGGMDKCEAAALIARAAAQEVPELDREVFVMLVEDELSYLHVGNIARHRLRPSEFEAWITRWR
ncbi:MAG: hypothetical protein ACI9UA_005398 [Pseudoalteromonas tetraodonis]